MRKVSLLLLMTLLAYFTYAENIPVEKALQVATTFYMQSSGNVSLRSTRQSPLSLVYKAGKVSMLRSSPKETEYYVFNVENNGGFIIVSGDDRAYPILGYSFDGNFDPDNISPAMKEWLQMYQNEIAYAIKEDLNITTPNQWQVLEKDANLQNIAIQNAVEPLCKAMWGQDDPYNLLCPKSSITGCVATAMAIVMKYHEYPMWGTGSHIHTKNNELFVNFGNTT